MSLHPELTGITRLWRYRHCAPPELFLLDWDYLLKVVSLSKIVFEDEPVKLKQYAIPYPEKGEDSEG